MADSNTALRWRAALTQAARDTLAARWHNTLEALEAARLVYRALHAADPTDVRALRKAAQRVHDLEQLRAVLAPELDGAGVRRRRREHQGPGAIATTHT